jgi:hypothetical protein
MFKDQTREVLKAKRENSFGKYAPKEGRYRRGIKGAGH